MKNPDYGFDIKKMTEIELREAIELEIVKSDTAYEAAINIMCLVKKYIIKYDPQTETRGRNNPAPTTPDEE